MVSLSQEERDKFALWLEENAQTNTVLIEQAEKLGEAGKLMAKKFNAEGMACSIVAKILRNTESF